VHVDGVVEQPGPAVATRVVGELGVGQTADQGDVQVDVFLGGDGVPGQQVTEDIERQHCRRVKPRRSARSRGWCAGSGDPMGSTTW
jgi:hypothetical protein